MQYPKEYIKNEDPAIDEVNFSLSLLNRVQFQMILLFCTYRVLIIKSFHSACVQMSLCLRRAVRKVGGVKKSPLLEGHGHIHTHTT